MAKLLHMVAKTGSGEYIAILDDDEDVQEYLEENYSVYGVFHIEPYNVGSSVESLPLNRTFVEG